MADTTTKPTKTVAYRLFQYREELFCRNKSALSLASTKRKLTTDLISKATINVKLCSMDDVRIIKRQFDFKQKLQERIIRMKKNKKSKYDAPLRYLVKKLRQMNIKGSLIE